MFNFGLMGGIYAMLHAVHGLGDYWMQSDFQAQNKSKNWKALYAHVAVYSLAFLSVSVVLIYLAPGVPFWKKAILPFVIGIPHAWMDRRKFLGWFCAKTKGWEQPIQWATLPAITCAVRNHVLIAMDQKFHYACLLLTAVWLSWGVT